jgi:xylulokinase
VNSTEGAAFGAALLAAVGKGAFRGVPEACQAWVSITGRTAPAAADQAVYDRAHGLYRGLYPALKPTFDRLATL